MKSYHCILNNYFHDEERLEIHFNFILWPTFKTWDPPGKGAIVEIINLKNKLINKSYGEDGIIADL